MRARTASPCCVTAASAASAAALRAAASDIELKKREKKSDRRERVAKNENGGKAERVVVGSKGLRHLPAPLHKVLSRFFLRVEGPRSALFPSSPFPRDGSLHLLRASTGEQALHARGPRNLLTDFAVFFFVSLPKRPGVFFVLILAERSRVPSPILVSLHTRKPGCCTRRQKAAKDCTRRGCLRSRNGG